MPTFTVVCRSIASAVFYPGNAFAAVCKLPNGESVNCIFRTNYRDGFEAPLPTIFYAEITGVADNLAQAAQAFHGAALEVCTMLAFVTNADLGHLEVELAFDSSPQHNDHPFIQTFIPEYRPLHVPSRPIDPVLVGKFLEIITDHPEMQRMQKAIAQYCEALKRWNAGHGIVCLAHLYMGVEALTKACLREHLKKLNISEDDLVTQWGIQKKQLDNEVRRRLIFDGDVACFESAKKVSDEFEHGFGEFSKMQKPAGETVVKVAGYLRAAILKLTGAPADLTDLLLAPPYQKPRGPIHLIKKLEGTLVGAADNLAAAGQPYPILNWTSKISTVKFGDDGKYGFLQSDSFSPQIDEGVQLKLGSTAIWDDDLVDPDAVQTPPAPIKMSAIITPKNQPAPFTRKIRKVWWVIGLVCVLALGLILWMMQHR